MRVNGGLRAWVAARRALRAFARARTGLAALEFALIAPLMIVLLLTSIELINALQANRRVENTAVSVADVISRDTEISNAELTGMWSAVAPLMYPDSAVGVDVRITSISIQANGKGKVDWCEVCAVAANGACSSGTYVDIPNNTEIPTTDLPEMNTSGSSLIRVEVSYDYEPILGFFYLDENRDMTKNSGIIRMEHVSYRRSRLVDPIPRVS